MPAMVIRLAMMGICSVNEFPGQAQKPLGLTATLRFRLDIFTSQTQ